MTDDPPKKYFHISTLAKGLRVIEILSDEKEISVSKLSQISGLNRTSSHRFLSTLTELGYVARLENANYRLTLKILAIGMKLANKLEVSRIARPHMRRIQSMFSETVNLGLWDGESIIHLDKIDSREILRLDCDIGTLAPAYCTSLGKAVLAHLPPEELDTYLQTVELKRYTPNTITSRKKLLRELKEVKENGFALDREELVVGLQCVGVPIFDYTGRANHSISIAGISMRMAPKLEEIIAVAKNVSESLSIELCGNP